MPINSNPGEDYDHDYTTIVTWIPINKRPGGDISNDYDGGNDDYDNIFNKSGGGEQDNGR